MAYWHSDYNVTFFFKATWFEIEIYNQFDELFEAGKK